MSRSVLPTRRFRGIGASKEEVDEMEAAFRRSDLVVQKDLADHLRGLSVTALRKYLADWREKHAPAVEAPSKKSKAPESPPEGLLGEDTGDPQIDADEDLPGPTED